jgi:hypothetical protein
MRSLPKPPELAEEIFRDCIADFRNGEKKDRLIASAPAVAAAAADFDERAQNQNLHEFAPHSHVNGNVTAKEMMNVYTQKFVPKDRPGRELYLRLRNLSPLNRCPLCCHHSVSTLDHHLNKADYPIFSVTPFNLVPSCRDCNTIKLSYHPATAEEVSLHPYYDSIELDEWLAATVHETIPAAVTYSVVRPEGWGDLLFARTRNHFSVLELAPLFGTHAAEELINKRSAFIELHAAGGAAEVRADIIRDATSFTVAYRNSWRAALYRGLAASDWFCDGGFRN